METVLQQAEGSRVSNEKGVLIVIPTTGRPVPIAWAFALKAMTVPPVFLSTIFAIIGKPLDEARNLGVQKAIKENYKYILFLDDDTVGPPSLIRRFLTLMENNPNMDFVSAVVCTRDDIPQPMVFRGLGNGPFWNWQIGEVFWATAGAIGCSMIRTSAFKRVQAPWFKRIDNETGGVDEGMYFYDQLLKSYDWKDADDPVGILAPNAPVATTKYPIWIDGKTLCEHHDVNTGAVHVLPPDSLPWRAE